MKQNKTSTIGPVATSVVLFSLTALCVAVSSIMVSTHIEAMVEARDVSGPFVAELPLLERTKQTLEQQVEVTELSAALQPSSHDENIQVYVLPAQIDIDRVLSLFDLIREHFGATGELQQMSQVKLGGTIPIDDTLSFAPVSLSLLLTDQSAEQLLSLFDSIGMLTVYDVFQKEDIQDLFTATEAENPAGIAVLEQFLSTDLLTYILDNRSSEKRLQRSYSSPAFESALQSALQSSGMKTVQNAFGNEFGFVLQDHELWPLPLMTIDHIKKTKEQANSVRLDIDLRVYQRSL